MPRRFHLQNDKNDQKWSKIEFFGRVKMQWNSKKLVSFESFWLVSKKKLKNFVSCAVFTFKTTKNYTNCQKFNFSSTSKCDGAPKNWRHLKACAMLSEKRYGNFGCRTVFTFKTTKKRPKMVKNWICRARQDAKELQKIGAIWKFLPWWVKKITKFWLAQHFHLRIDEMTQIGQKLKFSGVAKCNGAPKIWCHLQAFAIVIEKNYKSWVVAPFPPS